MKFLHASCLMAFQPFCVGSKVTKPKCFMDALEKCVQAHINDRIARGQPEDIGQLAMHMPEGVPFVSAGVGRRTANELGFVCRSWRGRVDCFLRRTHAEEVSDLTVVVYSRAAYLADPETVSDLDETARVEADPEITHVLVAVLASAGPKPPVSPLRFVSNLAGGNAAYAEMDADRIRAVARAVVAYDHDWVVVSD